jgi:WD40 repeat protein
MSLREDSKRRYNFCKEAFRIKITSLLINKKGEMTKIFISYSRKDIEFARRLTSELQKNGVDFWIDWKVTPVTTNWWEKIEEADTFVFLVSPDSVSSKACQQEIEYATRNGKRLISLIIRDTKENETPPQINSINHIYFFRKEDDFDTSIRKLLNSIQADLEWVYAHHDLQVNALRWERNHKEKFFLLRGKKLKNAEAQLSTNSLEKSYPTVLQQEYVHESRQAANRQSELITSINIVFVIVLVVLGVLGLWHTKVEADRVKTALSIQLTTQAQDILKTSTTQYTIAVLLATQSMKIAPSEEAAQILLSNSFADRTTIPITYNNMEKPIAFSPNGKYVASGSGYHSFHVWEIATGDEVAHMNHDGAVNSLAFSSDGEYIVSGSDDNTARVWETMTGKEVVKLSHSHPVASTVFSSDGEYILTGTKSPSFIAHVWKAKTGDEVATFYSDRPNLVTSITFSPNDKHVMFKANDRTVREWDIASGGEIARGSSMNFVAFSPNGKYVASKNMQDDVLRILSVDTGKEIFQVPCDDVASVAFSHDSKYVAARGHVWESATGVEFSSNFSYAYTMAFSTDDRYIVTSDGAAHIWEFLTGKEVVNMSHEGSNVQSVAFSPDGMYVVTGGLDRTVRVWKATTGEEISRMTHEGMVWSVVFSPNGKFVASGSNDNTACVWEAETGKKISCMIHKGRVNAIAFSPNGEYVVSGSNDGTVRVWEAKTGREIARVIHDGYVNSVAFSPDGKYVVSGSADYTARVWMTMTGREIIRLTHGGEVYSVAFGPDDKYIASGSTDKNVYIWQWRPEDLITSACGNLPRNLTRAEWEQYISNVLPYQAVCPNLPIDIGTPPTSIAFP